MKNLMIFGEKGYISTNYYAYSKMFKDMSVRLGSSRDNLWKHMDFSEYTTILYTAGIAHVSTVPSMESLYYEVNRNLPIAVAHKAKSEGVKHFIFLSSMIVYGDDLPIGYENTITEATIPAPCNFYGMSKLQAEEGLLALQDNSFSVSIIRLPMVYGEGCKGNFPKLVSLAQKLPVFPAIDNRRSMIYIGNLCTYIKMVIDTKMTGVLFPQNTEYVSTLDIIRQASKFFGHKVCFTGLFNPLFIAMSRKVGVLRKLFGSKVYSRSLSPNLEAYNVFTFEQSMERYIASILLDKL